MNEIQVGIRIAHYPSYASKWNPIEHRLFCHITRSMRGVILKSYDIVTKLIESTVTKTGLKVKAWALIKIEPVLLIQTEPDLAHGSFFRRVFL